MMQERERVKTQTEPTTAAKRAAVEVTKLSLTNRTVSLKMMAETIDREMGLPKALAALKDAHKMLLFDLAGKFLNDLTADEQVAYYNVCGQIKEALEDANTE